MMPFHSRLILGLSLFVMLSACNGSPAGPTPPPSTCSYSLSTTALSFVASGGSSTVAVTTTIGCAWTATSDREWATITSGASGSGTGMVSLTVTANPGTTVRTGTMTIAGQSVSVREDPQPACSVTLVPPNALHSQNPATGTFTVVTPSYCQWSASSSATWLTVTSGTQGTGNGTVAYAIDRNRDTGSRTASIIVNEKGFSVVQEAETASCSYSITPIDFTPCMSVPFNMTALVSTQATCSWTTTTASPWITVVEGQSGSGPGIVSFRVSDNWDTPRQGVVEVRWPTITAGQNLHVAQAGCYYGVSTNSINLAVAGGSGHFDVVQQSDPNTCGGPLQDACVWTAVSTVPWITISTSMPRTGDNPVNFVVAPNGTGSPRSGTIVVRDKTVTITQSGS